MRSDMLLQRVKKVRISDTVVDQIVALIEKGRLKVGDQLPGERELVAQLQVGRASVREALRMLEAQGMLEVHPGKGTFITGEIGKLSSQEAVRRWFHEHAGEVLDILEIREALERRAAFRAATAASPKVIAEMEAVLDQATTYIEQGDLESLGYIDREFHRLIGHASGNGLLSELVDGMIEALVSPRRTIQQLPGRAQASLQEHHVILNAIKAHDPQAAEQAMSDHIGSVRAAIASLREESDDE